MDAMKVEQGRENCDTISLHDKQLTDILVELLVRLTTPLNTDIEARVVTYELDGLNEVLEALVEILQTRMEVENETLCN